MRNEILKPSYGVIVGRFQVNELHDGHLELFRQVRARHNAVLVAVGVSPSGLSQSNPLDFPVRQKMIQAQFPDFIVFSLPDMRDDETWSRQLDSKIEEHIPSGFGDVVLYGGRDSFTPHYHGRHHPVELTLPIETQQVSGTNIRKQFSNTVIQSPDFRAGMIYAAHHRWPEILACVDVAPMTDDFTEVLLARREEEKQWRFIGGHAEHRHGMVNPYEKGAHSEALEEGGIDLIDYKYVGSAIVDDWRIRGCADKSVMTSFFVGRVSSMGARAGDDVFEVRWFKISDLTTFNFVPEHAVLFTMLMDYLKKGVQHATAIQSQPVMGN